MTRSRTLLLAGAVGLTAVGVGSGPMASAHPVLVSSDPPAGGTLVAAVSPVLRFAEPVVLSGSELDLMDAGGAVAPLTPLGHLGGDTRSVTAVPSPVPTTGPVTLRWRTLAEDGHRQEGTLALVLGAPLVNTATTAETSPTGPPAPAGTRWFDDVFTATRMLGYLSMTVLCGGLAFLALAWPEGAAVRRVRRLLWAAWATGVVTSVAGVGLQAAYAGHLGFGGAVDSSVVLPGLDSRVGLAWASRGLLFVLAVPVLAGLAAGGPSMVRSLSWRVGAAAVAVGLLRTPGLTGHSTEARMAWLGSIADMAHLVGVAVWLGGLVLLCSVVLPRRQPDELRRVISRFSTMAGTSVAVVVLAGSFLSWQLVGSFGALTGTRYGHVLFVKLTLVAAIAGAALISHRWAAHRLEVALSATGGGGGDVTLRPFVLSVATEVVLAVAVLTVASVLVTSSPGR